MDVIVCFSFDHLVGLKNWPNLLKFGGFGGGKIGTVDTKIGTVHLKFGKNSDSARSDFFHPVEFLNTACDLC
jgi:hypothetical protein